MYIRNDISSLIFFAFWHRKCPPAGRQGRPKRPIVDCEPIIFLLPLLTGKVADNQIFQFAYSQMHQNPTLIDLDSGFSIGPCWRPRRILIVADSVESARAPAVRFDP